MGANFLDMKWQSRAFFMGSYGIGISRLLAVAVESKHDEKGMIWGRELAPFELIIIVSSIKDDEQIKFSEEIYEFAKSLGIRVILDDRNERFGVKMSEFELIGFPYAIIVGKGAKRSQS